jgi:hypothetical protein
MKETGYKRTYPRFKTCRLSYKNLEKIRARATRYAQTVDEIVGEEILSKLEDFEARGYEIKGDVQHW